MKGWRTIIGMGIGVLAAGLTLVGVEVTEQDQGALLAFVIAVYGIWMRFQTDTEVGEK